MKKTEIKGMLHAMAAGLQSSGLSSKLYSDWAGVEKFRAAAGIYADAYCVTHDIDARPRVLWESVETLDTCKRYFVVIEDEETGERYGAGCIVASFAGTMEQPWSRYDLCATWWA